ncbi:tetratricopeptide repeat protein [Zooshikella marina]|uniref:tetratricopeptide repeat protein n=1 Tax=Zooshikella ganghwensis TaxID=202772 RepID=UPI001BAFC368|nr:tetratricopeptide repeat protein [Zooshikella ganghwensis]MBU2704667.1 tetratricopeptide repeat protein [Zooshikella ganghwensis]
MSNNPYIVDVTVDNFQQEVVEKSQTVPVLLDFWADWCQPCKSQLPILEKLATAYGGKFIVAKVNADEQPMLAQHLAVRSLPTLKIIFQGQIAQEFSGLTSEADLKVVLDELTLSPADRIQKQVDALIEEGQFNQALLFVQQMLQSEPDNQALKVQLAKLLLQTGKIEDAKQVMASIPDDAPGIEQPKAKIAFYEMAAELPPSSELEAQASKQPEDLEVSFQLAIRRVVEDEYESALSLLFTIVQKDRTFREDGARLLMLQIFDLLGSANDLVKSFRRKLFSLMH